VFHGVNLPFPGATLELDHESRFQKFHVKKHEDKDIVVITVHHTVLSVGAKDKGNYAPVELHPEQFRWRVLPVGDARDKRFYVSRTDDDDDDNGQHLVLGQSPIPVFPPRVDTQYLRPGPYQVWQFDRLDDFEDFEQETRSNCGPKRIPRDSFYSQ
jgi:hypothetical protein